MTPERFGSELAALMRAPAGDEVRADFGRVTRILNAERRLALVELSGGAVVAVPYGVGKPTVGHRYPVYSTPAGDRWLKVALGGGGGGPPGGGGSGAWCHTWTLNDDFDEEGNSKVGDLLDPSLFDRLALHKARPYGSGADGAGSFDSTAGDANLNLVSICGRASPDAAFATATAWSTVLDPSSPSGLSGIIAPAPAGLLPGDEFVIYVAQAKQGADAGMEGFVGRWETHVSAGGGVYDDYVVLPPAAFDMLTVYVQRVPNYTTLTRTGGGAGDLTVGTHGVDGTGFLFIRCRDAFQGRANLVGKGYAGGTYSGTCTDDTDHRAVAGHGKRAPKVEDKGAGVFGGGGGGHTHMCGSPAQAGAHTYDPGGTDNGPPPYKHAPLIGTSGGGGGSAVAGVAGGGSSHRIGAVGTNHSTGLTGGNAGVLLGAGRQTDNSLYGHSLYGGGGGGGGIPDGGAGGRGGGVFICATPVFGGSGDSFSHPTVTVNGAAAIGGTYVGATGGSSGGGAAGSIVVWTEALSSSLINLHAEVVGLTGGGLGRSGQGAPGFTAFADGPFINQVSAGGDGAVGPIQLTYLTDAGAQAVGVVTRTSVATLAFAGCWMSGIYDSARLGLDAGLPLEPTSLNAAWILDGDGITPTFSLLGGDRADLSDGIAYPLTGERVWRDGGEFDIDNTADLDLTPYVLPPALYWRVAACLDSGADVADTPSVEEITLCGIAG
jgi:hypothetical protein